MPFEIVRNDIINMRVDAIVNTANPRPVIGSGVDSAVHKKAGPELLEARRAIGRLRAGEVAVTPAFALEAKLVLHAVSPVWRGGWFGEREKLRRCYDAALQLALERGCESIAFPLLATGNYSFPKPLALEIAIAAFSGFLLRHEMQIYLVVFEKESFALSEKLQREVKSYIDENYVREKLVEEVDFFRESYPLRERRENDDAYGRIRAKRKMPLAPQEIAEAVAAPMCASAAPAGTLDELLEKTDEGFSRTLLMLIDKSGKKDPEIYKKANVDRKLFSKIRNDPNYKPSKTTALAFALALEMDLEETKDFIARAGYALSRSSKADVIVEFFIRQKNYDIFAINEVLFAYDQPLIGA